MLSGLLGEDDLVKDIRNDFNLLFVAENLPLIATKEELDVEAINILQQILIHGILRLAESENLQIRVLTLDLPPVSVCITA